MLNVMICLFFCNSPAPEPQNANHNVESRVTIEVFFCKSPAPELQNRNRNVERVVLFLMDLPRKNPKNKTMKLIGLVQFGRTSQAIAPKLTL